MRVLDHQAPRAITSHRRPWLYSARPTKRGLALYTITVYRESHGLFATADLLVDSSLTVTCTVLLIVSLLFSFAALRNALYKFKTYLLTYLLT